MRIFLPQPPPDVIRRFEAAAAARPNLYRARLALFAISGEVILTLVRVLPLAGPIVLFAIYLDHPIINVIAAAATLLLIWLVRPSFRFSGVSIAREDAAALFAVLDELRSKIDVGGQMDVRLDDEFNAGAGEMRGLLGLVGTRRVLTLGTPLLALLGEDEARAIIAHEFGHFSRRHGRFGHWLYWAHLGWLDYAEEVDHQSSMLERVGASFAELFVPAFSRRAMVWSRACEYEADADAASAVGGKQVVSALARLNLFHAWFDTEQPRIVHSWQCSEPSPPDDWLERTIASFEATPDDVMARLESNASSRSRDWDNTHPVLAERAAALGVPPALAPRGRAAGPALFGARWPTVIAEHNARWRSENAVEWSIAHARYRLIEAPLLAADAATVATWPVDQQLQRARALRRSEPARGLNELAALSAAFPDNRSVTFACAAARLAENDAGAVETMRKLAQDSHGWRVPVCLRLVRYYDRIGDRTGVDRWARQLETSGELEARARAAVSDELVAGRLQHTTRPAAIFQTLCAGLLAEPAIAKAWLVAQRGQLATAGKSGSVTVQVDALVLVVDPFDAAQRPFDLGAIRGRQQQALSDLIEPDALAVVIAYYATEPLPTALSKALEQSPAGCAYVRS